MISTEVTVIRPPDEIENMTPDEVIEFLQAYKEATNEDA